MRENFEFTVAVTPLNPATFLYTVCYTHSHPLLAQHRNGVHVFACFLNSKDKDVHIFAN